MADTLEWIYDNAFMVLQVSVPSATEALLMQACLYSAQRHAEKLIDFELSKAKVYLTIDATNGGSITTGPQRAFSGGVPSGDSTVYTKKIRRIDRWDTTNSIWVPATLMTYDYYLEHAEQIGRKNVVSYTQSTTTNYPDTVFPTRYVYLREGDTIFSSDESATATDTQLRMFVYLFTEPFDAVTVAEFDTVSNFLTLHCASYLMWWAVREYNSRSANFVPRNEGSLDPAYIDARVEEAWQAMVAWNAELSPSQNYLGAPY